MKKLLDENPDTPCTLRGTEFAAKDVFDAARNGDALAAREVDEMTDTLAWRWQPLPPPWTRRCSWWAAAYPAPVMYCLPAAGAFQGLCLQVLP